MGAGPALVHPPPGLSSDATPGEPAWSGSSTRPVWCGMEYKPVIFCDIFYELVCTKISVMMVS